MHTLSERLSIIASFVPKGKSVCDVGTDHGYLPAALYLSGKYSSVTATDIRQKPLDNAKKNIEKLKADGVKLVLCDGLSGVAKEDAQVVIISGMGGDVISGIMDRCPFAKSSTFILQPMTASATLREYLANNGFAVKKEKAVIENNKVYSVMLCEFDGVKRELSAAKKRIGELRLDTEENIIYIKKQLSIAKKCVFDLQSAGRNNEVLLENEKAVEELTKITEG